MIYSYDLFDTLFTRVFFDPNDLYIFLEKRLKEDELIGKDIKFSKIRIESEEKVRKNSIKEDINFDEIYQELQKNLKLNQIVIDKIKKLELEFEEFSLSVIDEIKCRIDKESILISDIYFKKDFVQHLLRKYNISYNKLYVSSDSGLMKHYGSMFKMILSELNLTGDQLTHIGDNIHSDVKMPNKYKIRTSHYMNSNPTRYENDIYAINQKNKLNSILAGSMRSSRLEGFYDDKNQQTIWNVATNVAGPFLFLYTFWILRKAHQLKIENLYFIARDGQIIWKIAKILNRYLGYKVNLKYLYGSRKAWHLASLKEISERDIDWIFDPTQYLNINTICSRVEIEPHSIAEFLAEIDITDNYKKLNHSEIEKTKNLFVNNKTIKELIISKAQQKRFLVSRYLKQVGFDSDKTIGIVDVGWRARQQNSLSRILQMEDLYPDSGVNGFYISLPNEVQAFSKDNTYEYLPFSGNESIIYGYSSIFESFAAADHGSCAAYREERNNVIPVLRETKNTKMLEWGLEIHQKGILNFTKKITKSFSFLKLMEIKDNQNYSKVLLYRFLKYPTKQEALTYNNIYCYEDQEEDNGLKLSSKLSTLNLMLALIRPRLVFHPNSWKEASFAISIKKYYQVYQMLFRFAHKVINKVRLIYR